MKSALQVWFSGRRRKDKLAMEKLQAKAGGAPYGGTPGSSPAPPSPQSQQLSMRPPAGASSPSAAQQRTERPVADVNGMSESQQATPAQHAAPMLQTAASLSDVQEQMVLPVNLSVSMLMPREDPWTRVLHMTAATDFTAPFRVWATQIMTMAWQDVAGGGTSSDMDVAWPQEEVDVTDEAELKELLAVARSQLPAELTTDDAPPLGYVFDTVPVAAEARGEKRKRIMIDNLEMEGNVGGHVNVMRNVRTAPVTRLRPPATPGIWRVCVPGHASRCRIHQGSLQPELELFAGSGKAQHMMLQSVRQHLSEVVELLWQEWGAPKRPMSREERDARRWEDAQSRENAKLRVAQEREARRMAEQADKEHRAAARKQESERRRQCAPGPSCRATPAAA